MLLLPDWTPGSDSESRRNSSIALACAVLAVRDQLTTPHLREVLKVAVWKYTECDGKYTTRFRSEAALSAPPKLVHHEHVFPIRTIVDRLIADPGNAETTMRSAVACVVLRSEHVALSVAEAADPTITGWERYRMAGIAVWDLLEQVRVT